MIIVPALFTWRGNESISQSEFTAKQFSVMSENGDSCSGLIYVVTAIGLPRDLGWKAVYLGNKGGQDRFSVSGSNGFQPAVGENQTSDDLQFARDRISDFAVRMFITERLREFRRRKNGFEVTAEAPPATNPAIRVKVSEIQAFAGQPREEFDDELSMAESLNQEGQLQDIIVTPLEGVPGKKWELVDGERRLRGAIRSNTMWVDVKVRIFKDKAEQFWSSFVANLQRSDHTPHDYSNAIAKAFAIGKSLQEICRATGRKPYWVSQTFQLQKLAPSLRQLLRRNIPKEQQMRMGVARVLSKISDQNVQIQIWEKAREEKTPGLVKLKVDELAKPFIAKSTTRIRKTQPSDRAARMARIIRSSSTDAAFLDTLSIDDVRVFLGKDVTNGCSLTVQSINTITAAFERLKEKLLKISDEKNNTQESRTY